MSDTFLFCGTGAADYSAPEEGKEFRKFTHSLLNDIILFDIGSMTYRFEDMAVLDARFSKVKHVLITHSHGDHFYVPALQHLAETNGKITVYIDAACVKLIPEDEHIQVVAVHSGDVLDVEGYKLFVFTSNHRGTLPEETTHHYIVDTPNGKTLFYGLDGAWLMMDEGKFLMKHPADLMVLDCTTGVAGDLRAFEHNTVDMLRVMMDTIRSCHMVRENGVIYADHLARTRHPCHKTAAEVLAGIGMCTAYDGLCIEF